MIIIIFTTFFYFILSIMYNCWFNSQYYLTDISDFTHQKSLSIITLNRGGINMIEAYLLYLEATVSQCSSVVTIQTSLSVRTKFSKKDTNSSHNAALSSYSLPFYYCGEFDNSGAKMTVENTIMCSFQSLKPASAAQQKLTYTKPGKHNGRQRYSISSR